MTTQSVHFEELVELLKNHIEAVETTHHRSTSGRHRAAWKRKLQFAWMDFIGIRHLPFFLAFWIGMGAFKLEGAKHSVSFR